MTTDIHDNNDDNALQNSYNELLERHMRLQADMDNMRKREADKLMNAYDMGVIMFLTKLLPAYKTLLLAMQHTSDNDAKNALEQYNNALTTLQCTLIVPQKGDNVDTNIHDVVAVVDNDILDVVIDVYENGYMYKDTVLIPAKVSASRTA